MATKIYSFDETRALVSAKLAQGKTPDQRPWIVDIYPSEVIWSSDYGKAYNKASYTIDSEGKVTLGDTKKVIRATTYETVTLSTEWFDLDQSDEVIFSDHIVRNGKIFEAGEYKDKAFSITEDELAAAVAGFSPCDVDYQHVSGPLDGQLGKLEKVWIGDDKKSLFGSVSLPKWLDDILPIKKVSATWDRAKKTIRGLALVTNPRVTDAAVMAAFAGSRHSTADLKDLQSIHDILVKHGVSCATDVEYKETEEMALDQAKLLTSITETMTTLLDRQNAETAPVNAAFASDPAFKEMREQLDDLRKERAKERAFRIQTEAIAFARDEIRESRALPSEEDVIVAAYAQAALDDVALPAQVSFAVAGVQTSGTRVDALKAMYAARKPHTLTGEQIKPPVKPEGTQSNNEVPSDEEKRKLMGSSQLGKAIIRGKK